MQVFVTINNLGIMINVDANIKNWLMWGVCDKGYIWNSSNCECDKSWDVGEYLDYKNCKCNKILIEECSETVKEVKIVSENKNKYSSCILYIVLFSIIFIINIGIATYSVYYKHMNHDHENVSKYDYVYQSKNY